MTPFFSRRRREQDLDEEIETHIRLAIEERVARGESWAQAERTVRREFGDVIRVKEVTRTMWGGMWLERLLQDLRFGLRSLTRDRGFAVVAVLTLALGVGVTTAMFTVVNGVLFRPLPFFEPNRLVAVGVRSERQSEGRPAVLDEHFFEIRREAESFSHLLTYMTYPPTTLTDAGEPARMRSAFMTADFLDVVGVGLALGNGFTDSDDVADASPVVILGNALWRNRFGADPAVLGRTATLDGVPRTVVGVMPAGFDYPDRTDLWLPLTANPLLAEGLSFANEVVARLGEGVTTDQAVAELSALATTSEWDFGGAAPNVRVIPLKDVVVGESRYPLLIFTGAVALVLLISCTNVANLLLMRAGTREREIGLRKALGAGRPRLLRQLLTESVLVAFLGGAVGILLASVGVRALLALAPAGTIPRGQELGIDLAVLTFTVAVSTLTGIGFGLAPAFKATGRELRDTITEGARTHTPRRDLGRSVLVVAEVGLAVVLLTGAGLLLRSFQQIRAIDLGFEPENTLSFYVDLPESSYTDLEPILDLHSRVLAGLRRIPGIEAAGAANFEIFGPLSTRTGVTTEGTEESFSVGRIVASPGYLPAMGITLLSGRGFTVQDEPSAPLVAVISKSMADQVWPNQDPIGKVLSRNRSDWMTVVGVADDVVRNDVTENRGPLMYMPLAQIENAAQGEHMSYVVRTSSRSSGDVPGSMRAVLREADPNLPVGSITTMDQVVINSLGDRLFQTRVLSVFAILAMLLAAVGVYGVTAYSVNERTQELGIRMALGARAEEVAKMTLGHVLRLVIPGLLVGVTAAMAATRFIASSLYEIAPGDPVTFVTVALLLGAVAITAALVPARRATRINPVEVLSG